MAGIEGERPYFRREAAPDDKGTSEAKTFAANEKKPFYGIPPIKFRTPSGEMVEGELTYEGVTPDGSPFRAWRPPRPVEQGERQQPRDTSSQEQGGLDRARVVLHTIVNTHESTIGETTPFDRIAGLTTEQVRQAERVVAQQIMNEGENGRFDSVTKMTPQGRLEMFFDDPHEVGKWEVALYLLESGSGRCIVGNSYALDQPGEGMEHYYGFEDYRPGGKQARLSYLSFHSKNVKDRQLDDIRIMWRGLRWMNANLLNWDKPNVIMPEELDDNLHTTMGKTQQSKR